MRGIEFVVDEAGERKAVLIDLRKHGELWEDFYDTLMAKERESEPRGDAGGGEREAGHLSTPPPACGRYDA